MNQDQPLVPAVEIEIPQADREAIVAEVDRLLAEGRFSQGKNVLEFEKEFAGYVGTQHAVALSSGTMALELSFMALGTDGHEVLVPANTNFATFIAAARTGADVRLVDVDPYTLSPTLSQVQAEVTDRTTAVVLVHMGGIIGPDTEKIADWCGRHDIALVEDCAHAHGSARGGLHAGRFGVAGAFSFFATKVMTSGEGGMVVTDDADLAQEIRLLRNLGKPEAWTSRHVRPGINGRMHEWAAVIGRRQLASLDDAVRARQRVAAEYWSRLAELPDVTPLVPDHPYSGYKVPVLLPPGVDRSAVKEALAARGVRAAGEVYEIPLHRQPVLRDRYGHQELPGSQDACSRQLCLPVYPSLDTPRVDRVVAALADALGELGPAERR